MSLLLCPETVCHRHQYTQRVCRTSTLTLKCWTSGGGVTVQSQWHSNIQTVTVIRAGRVNNQGASWRPLNDIQSGRYCKESNQRLKQRRRIIQVWKTSSLVRVWFKNISCKQREDMRELEHRLQRTREGLGSSTQVTRHRWNTSDN